MRRRLIALSLFLLLVVLPAWAEDLRQAAKNGRVVRSVETSNPEFKDGPGLIGGSEVVVVAQVVDERARLSADGALVVTDYTLLVSEVWVDPKHRTAANARLVVTHPGGELALDGVPVRVETPDFRRLEWLVPYIFFLEPSNDELHIRGGAQGVWRLDGNKVRSHLTRRNDYVVRRLYNGEPLDYFQNRVRNVGQSNPRPRDEPAPADTAKLRREVLRPAYPSYFGLGEMVVGADLIVHGRVIAAAPRRAGDGAVWSDYTVEIVDTLKGGRAESPVTVTVEGGNLAREDLAASSVNELAPPLPWGRELLLLLTADPDQPGRYRFLGGGQGVFWRDDESKARCLLPKGEWNYLCSSRDGSRWDKFAGEIRRAASR